MYLYNDIETSFNMNTKYQLLKALKPTCTVNNPEKVLPVLPVPEVVSVLDVRVVLE